MNIAVYGAGYVGLVSAVCFAKLGHRVLCVDINKQRVASLNEGQCPIYEEGLSDLLQAQLGAGQLRFTSGYGEAVSFGAVHIIATGTPDNPDGSADLTQVYKVALQIAREAEHDCVVVIKSTVPVGTGDAVQRAMEQSIQGRDKAISVTMASNPEFLREGTAVSDFLNADRIIAGGDERAVAALREIHQPLIQQGIPFLSMDRRSAELTKYAANAMLATRISFINQISQLAEKLNANIDDIREGLALDARIGPHFLQPGIGYGGSCFPKDVRALTCTARQERVDTRLLEAVETVNDIQKNWMVDQLRRHFEQRWRGLRIGVWGLAFKPGTDDMREASSLVVLRTLLDADARLVVFDPAAMPNAKKMLGNPVDVQWCSSADEVLEQDIDALLILTEWPEFRRYPLTVLCEKLHGAPVFDGRNCYSLHAVSQSGIRFYYSVGRPAITRSCDESQWVMDKEKEIIPD
ncbi:UDP-glucose dehydrogenase family protein [Legionella spiritensis]|uniref:UDP-glucose dehydrogenase family protein n=1 Tax=Legionella spiritensis TaxID=452 RepID=UPI000F71EA79|nr:UDP-glucose/GDP-mannose dehydrogenase family protein [Legionella spiritensis]VEG90533.1 UDP-glucose 6-dehydrogenase [Legionella spiritensis]